MNLHLQPQAGVRLLGTAIAQPLDLAPAGQRGERLSNEAVYERVLGPGWAALRERHLASAGLGAEPQVSDRQWVQGGAHALDLATCAAQRALAAADLRATDLAAIICVTSTPPVISAAMAARVGRALGCDEALCHAAAQDVRAGGVGVMMAWFSAQGLILQGSGPVLIVAAEAASAFMRPGDIGTALLYADGAGACILGPVHASSGAGAAHSGPVGGGAFLGGLAGQVALQGRPTTIPGILPPPLVAGLPDISPTHLDYRFHRPDAQHLQDLLALWGRFPPLLAEAFPQACAELRHFLPYAVSTRQMAVAQAALGQPQAQVFHELARFGCLGAASPLVALYGLIHSGQAQAGEVVALASAAGNGLWAGFFWRLG